MGGQMDFLFFPALHSFGTRKVTTHYFKQFLYFRETCGNSALWVIHTRKCMHIHLCSEVSKTKQETDEDYLKQGRMNTSKQRGLSFTVCNLALLFLQLLRPQ